MREPSGWASSLLEPFLAFEDRVSLAQTSLHLRHEMLNSVRFLEHRHFLPARDAYRRAQKEWEDSVERNKSSQPGAKNDTRAPDEARTRWLRACAEIAHARHARHVVQPLYRAYRQAMQVLERWPNVSADELLALERPIVEAADLTDHPIGLWAELLHDQLWDFHDLSRAHPRYENAIAMKLGALRSNLSYVANRCLEAMTADLHRARDPADAGFPKRMVHFVDHFADEPWAPGKTLVQAHIDPRKGKSTKTIPFPGPAEGITRCRLQFGRASYVHTFNLPRPPVTRMEDVD